MPAAVCPLEADEEVERVGGTRIVELAHARQDEQRLRDLVVPVRRVVRDEPTVVDRLAGLERAEEVVLEEELSRAIRALPGQFVAGRGPVLVQPPHRRKRLVEG